MRSLQTLGGLVAPAPLILGGIVAAVRPPELLESGLAATYPEALGRALTEFWAALVIAQAVAFALAVLCYRRQVRYGAGRAERVVWPLFVLFKAFLQYEQATGDPRIVPAMLRACKKIDEVTTREPLYRWARFRGADLIVGLHWLHDKTGDPSVLALADKIYKQSYNWRSHFENFHDFREKSTKFGLECHGVNTGMALKFAGVRSIRR